MRKRFPIVPAFTPVACLLILIAATGAAAQNLPNRYVIPGHRSGSELVLANLSVVPVDTEVRLFSLAGAELGKVFFNIAGNTVARLDSATFGPGPGMLVVNSSGPLGVVGTLGATGGENVAAALESNLLIIPFLPASSEKVELTLFNSDPLPVPALIWAVAEDGTVVSTAQTTVPANGSVSALVNSFVPQAGADRHGEVSYLLIRALSNAVSPPRKLHAQARISQFSDPGVSPAVISSSAQVSPMLPFFMIGGGFATTVQVVNPSDMDAYVSVVALSTTGRLVSVRGFQLPANGSRRETLEDVGGTGAEIVTGSIQVTSDIPVLATETIANLGRGAFVLRPAEPANTNFAFSYRNKAPSSVTNLGFYNHNAANATVRLRSISDNGILDDYVSLTLAPSQSLVRPVEEMLTGASSRGFVYVTSDVPIFVSAVESSADRTSLVNVPAMHSQPGFIPPNPTVFRISGSIRFVGNPLAGVRVQLTGAVSRTVTTDKFGSYTFERVPAGQYRVEPSTAGFVFSPLSRPVTVTADDTGGHDFESTPVGSIINSVQPSGIVGGSPNTVITVSGEPFDETTVIVFEQAVLATTLVAGSPPTLRATIPASALVTLRETSLSVRRTAAGFVVFSAPFRFVIGSAAPQLTSLGNVQQPLVAGASGFSMAVNGSGYLPGATVWINGVARESSLESPTTLRVAISSEELARPNVLTVTVLNPSPTVGPSNALSVIVNSPMPVLSTISPATIAAQLSSNAASLSITVTGSSFIAGATVLLDNVGIPTQFVSSTVLTAVIPASLLQASGTFQVTVRNPEPSLGSSAAASFVVVSPEPILASIVPGSVQFDPVRAVPVAITLRGDNFAANSIFDFQAPCGSVFVVDRINAQTAVVTTTYQCPGTYRVRVGNPPPGGGISQTLSFTVN